MRYCLRCDIEFVDGITHCSDCGAPTVTEEAARLREAALAAAEQEPLDQVHTFEGPVDKAIICDMLRDAGIPFVVHDHSADALQPLMAWRVGGGALLVPRSFTEEVRDIIAAAAAAAPGP